jgi:hypothetical protein
MPGYLINNLIIAATYVAILLITGYVFVGVVRRRMAERHELRRTLLEKLSIEEIQRLLESDVGRGWLHQVLVGADDRRSAIERTMAVVFGSLGCGFAAILLEQKILGALAIIGLAAGLGQLITVIWMSRRGD